MTYPAPERKVRWRAHCVRMAEATSLLADWCDQPEMLRVYLHLARRWLQLADGEPPPPRARRAN